MNTMFTYFIFLVVFLISSPAQADDADSINLLCRISSLVKSSGHTEDFSGASRQVRPTLTLVVERVGTDGKRAVIEVSGVISTVLMGGVSISNIWGDSSHLKYNSKDYPDDASIITISVNRFTGDFTMEMTSNLPGDATTLYGSCESAEPKF